VTNNGSQLRVFVSEDASQLYLCLFIAMGNEQDLCLSSISTEESGTWSPRLKKASTMGLRAKGEFKPEQQFGLTNLKITN